jgi:hypothetical protein
MLADVLLGVKSPAPAMQVDPSQFADGGTPRLWYLVPQSELAGMLSTIRR